MCRLNFVDPEKASPAIREVFKKNVMVPNVLCLIANSEAVVNAFSEFNMDTFQLSQKHREEISLAVSQFNNCQYCLAVHTSNAIDGKLLTQEESIQARNFISSNPKSNVILKLTKELLENHGNISDDTLKAVRVKGFNDENIIEVIAIISIITLANYTANVGKPEMDYIGVPELDNNQSTD